MSAIRPDLRDRFTGLPYFAYDPSAGVIARSESALQTSFPLPHSGAGSTPARSSGVARFTLAGMQQSLTPYRREEDGGGANVLLDHATNGRPRYGGERYLLDTAKGADLGWAEGGIVFDFRRASTNRAGHACWPP